MKEPAAFPRWLALFFLAFACGCAPSALIPASIPTDRSALPELTVSLRARTRALRLNGIESPRGERVSRALVLLPKDRALPGVISFELERGPRAGVYQCEVLGRGRTSTTPVAGWIRGAIGKTTIYYAPMNAPNGATPVGIYDVRDISTGTYELAFLDEGPASVDGGSRRAFFSAIRRTWYPKDVTVMPIDMLWSPDYQRYSQGARFPIFEGGAAETDPLRANQLARNPRYYFGPFGRSGLANHTDLWDEPERRADPAYAGRPELADFRWRDTDGCLKVRADCLALLDEWVGEQAGLGRRVQYEIRQTRRLDRAPSR